jgi:DNA-binding MarR family transcriptional regulator
MQDKQAVTSHIMDNIRRIFQILNEQSQRVKQETGLTGPQLWTIRVIHEHAPIKISDIAKRIYLHPTTVLGMIDRLEARGLVSRDRSKNDRRIVWVELTPAGKNLVSSVPEVSQGLLGARLEGQPPEMLVQIDQGVEALVKIFHAESMPPKLIVSFELGRPERSAEP